MSEIFEPRGKPKKADTYLAWILPQETLEPHLIVRQSEKEAWKIADELLCQPSKSVLKQRGKSSENTSMVGQRSQSQRYGNNKMGTHLWNGISNVRVNCGTALVGNVEQVSEELLSYWQLGIDEFILSGFPHVTECNIVSEQLLPVLIDKITQELRV